MPDAEEGTFSQALRDEHTPPRERGQEREDVEMTEADGEERGEERAAAVWAGGGARGTPPRSRSRPLSPSRPSPPRFSRGTHLFWFRIACTASRGSLISFVFTDCKRVCALASPTFTPTLAKCGAAVAPPIPGRPPAPPATFVVAMLLASLTRCCCVGHTCSVLVGALFIAKYPAA